MTRQNDEDDNLNEDEYDSDRSNETNCSDENSEEGNDFNLNNHLVSSILIKNKKYISSSSEIYIFLAV